METVLYHYHHHNRLLLSGTATSCYTWNQGIRHIHQENPENASTRVRLVMRDLSLRTISASIASCNRFQRQRLLSVIVNSRMATKNDQPLDSIVENTKTKEEAATTAAKNLPPPPPEKPEPGDCCGSGCVRCVWDVYYEELEEYDKLYNSNSNTDKSKS